MPPRLDDGIPHALFMHRFVNGRRRGRQNDGQWNHHQGCCRQDHERALPFEQADGELGIGRKDELTEGAGGGAKPEDEGTPLRRHDPGHGGKRQGEGGEGDTETDQDTGCQNEHGAGFDNGHRPDSEGIDDRAADDHPAGTKAVGNHSGYRNAKAPDQVLHGERHGEHFPVPAVVKRHRLLEEPEDRTYAKTDHGNDAARGDHDKR